MEKADFARAQLILEFLRITAYDKANEHLNTKKNMILREALADEFELIVKPSRIKPVN